MFEHLIKNWKGRNYPSSAHKIGLIYESNCVPQYRILSVKFNTSSAVRVGSSMWHFRKVSGLLSQYEKIFRDPPFFRSKIIWFQKFSKICSKWSFLGKNCKVKRASAFEIPAICFRRIRKPLNPQTIDRFLKFSEWSFDFFQLIRYRLNPSSRDTVVAVKCLIQVRNNSSRVEF